MLRGCVLAFVAIVSFISNDAHAGNYYFVGANNTSVAFVDLQTIKKTGDLASGWMIEVNFTTQLDQGQQFDYTMVKYDVQCNADRMAISSVTEYTKDGTYVRSIDFSQTGSSDIVPGTNGAAVERTSCSAPPPATQGINVDNPTFVAAVRKYWAEGWKGSPAPRTLSEGHPPPQ